MDSNVKIVVDGLKVERQFASSRRDRLGDLRRDDWHWSNVFDDAHEVGCARRGRAVRVWCLDVALLQSPFGAVASTVAVAFIAIVIGLDALLVAPAVERNYAMFRSVAGTWIPFTLILISTCVVGRYRTSNRLTV